MIAIKEIASGSLGERAGFRNGDRILAINGEEIRDLIDFQVHSADSPLVFDLERGEEFYSVEVERVSGELMGLNFDEMRLRRCNNKCVFCFLHQMPGGLRRSLYFEDDDYRLSFLHGSYVTLTNMKDSDLQRIVEQGLTPQYISVHATDPDLRQALLGRRQPTVPILDRIRLLADSGIEMHAQVVICPGLNDGAPLERTIRDLGEFYPAVRSVAMVPVGLTRFRDHLPKLNPVTPELATTYVADAQKWGTDFVASFGERFVYAADELYLLSDRQLPAASFYDAFPQIENGIGMVRAFLDRWNRGLPQLAATKIARPLHLALVTGELAARFLAPVVEEIDRFPGVSAELVIVRNSFFGRGITVSGLLAGEDIANQLRGRRCDLALLPPNCVNGEGLTLDDLSVLQLEQACGLPVSVGDYDLARCLRDYLQNPAIRERGAGRQLSELGFFVGSDPGQGPGYRV